MRRIDREVTDPQRIREVIDACAYCRLGLQDGKGVYVVPVNFGYVEREGRRALYFHGARMGRKFELVQKNGYAGFEMDANYQLKSGETACQYSCAFQSVIGEGPICVVETAEEKREGLTAIMHQCAGAGPWEFSDAAVDTVCILRLDIEELACKEYQ